MGVLDGSSLAADVRIAPGKATDLIAAYVTTDGSGNALALSGYNLTEFPITRAGGTYYFDVGTYRHLLSAATASSGEGASTSVVKNGDYIQVSFPAAVTSGYISLIAYVDQEIA